MWTRPLIHEAAIGKIAGEQLLKLRTLGIDQPGGRGKDHSGFLEIRPTEQVRRRFQMKAPPFFRGRCASLPAENKAHRGPQGTSGAPVQFGKRSTFRMPPDG